MMLPALFAFACSPAQPPSTGPEAGAETTTADTPTSSSTEAPTTSGTAAPACGTCLGAAVRWGHVGGNALQRDKSAAEPCNTYTRTRTFTLRGSGQPPISCSDVLACDTSDTGTEKLNTLFSHPDVKKALTSPMTVYGCDNRPADGTLYGVETDGGLSFGVGDECAKCSMGGTCVPPPAAITALIDHLKRIDTQMLAKDPCKSLLGSP